MNVQSQTPFFDRVYDKTKEKTLAYITAKCGNLSDIQDIFQETYSELYSIIKKKGENYFQNETAFVLYLAKKKLARHYGKRVITLPLYNDEGEDIELPDEMDIEDSLVDKDMVNRIFEKLSEKPIEIQKIFHLRFYFDMKLSEIAQLMNMSETNVKHKLYRTINEMRTYFTEEGETK